MDRPNSRMSYVNPHRGSIQIPLPPDPNQPQQNPYGYPPPQVPPGSNPQLYQQDTHGFYDMPPKKAVNGNAAAVGGRDELAVAVDFGTTYSGVAYMPLLKEGAINYGLTMPTQIGRWPGQPIAASSFKVPTKIAYPSDGSNPLWGFQAEKLPADSMYAGGIVYHKCQVFKMFIEPATTKDFAPPPGKQLQDVVHDFLDGVYRHVVHILSEEGYSSTDFDYKILFTVPTPFSNAAVEAFRRIIKGTGWGSHKFEVELTEPEAAAIYTIRTQEHTVRRTATAPFQAKQCFLVCDAGGGTVDLASYTIASLVPTIKFEQTGVVHGGVCGSTFVDRAFQRYLKQHLGEQVIASLTPIERDAMLDQFILRKESFSNSPDEVNFNIQLPRYDIPCPDAVAGYLPISRDLMRKFFEDPLRETCELVAAHIQECAARGYQVSYIFLVGGFGTSPYLKAQLEAHLRHINPDLRIIKPPDAQQSVVLGCLSTQIQKLKKEVDPIAIRLARASYGVIVFKPFDRNRHRLEDKVVHPVTGDVLAGNQILWLIKKGERYDEGIAAQKRRDITRSFSKVASIWTDTLVSSEEDTPPDRLGPGVKIVCKLSSDMRSMPISQFRKLYKEDSGLCGLPFLREKYYEAAYAIKIFIGTADIKFEMWYNGMQRGDLLDQAWEELGDVPVAGSNT